MSYDDQKDIDAEGQRAILCGTPFMTPPGPTSNEVLQLLQRIRELENENAKLRRELHPLATPRP